MSQIELRVLKQGLETHKIISASFFTMNDAYRKLAVYESNLKHFSRISQLPGFCVRLYTDDSGQEIALRVTEKYDHITVIHFNCPEFREEVGHIGTFGTIVRFLPLFEAHELVWVSDIDIPADYLEPYHVKDMETAKADVHFRTFLCYDTKVYGRHYTIAAGTIISKIKFPKQILTKFLNKLADGGLNETIERLNTANLPRKKTPSKIPYGIDEVFTNTTFYDYMIRHEVRCLVIKDYASAGLYLRYRDLLTDGEVRIFERYYTKFEKELVPRMKYILGKKLPQIVDEKPCLKEILDLMPTIRSSFMKLYVVQGKQLE
jgi:hypothetical protein